MIHITVNGTKEIHEHVVSLGDVLKTRDITAESSQGVAVALNDRIVRRTEWTSTPIETGATVEIVTARQGG